MSKFDYNLSKRGSVLDKDGKVVKPYTKDGVKVIDIKIKGKEYTFDFDKVVLYASEYHNVPRITIPAEYIDRIHIHGKGKTGKVEYQYSPPIESPIKEFYYIPGYTDRVVSKCGRMKSLDNTKEYIWHKTIPAKPSIKGGYRSQVFQQVGIKKRRSQSRHRILLLAFVIAPEAPSLMVVNHLDGEPSNDALDNLEWTTYSKNTQHAYDNGLYPNKVTPIQRYNWITGELLDFAHVAECSRETGWVDMTIYSRLSVRSKNSDGVMKRYSDGIAFRLTPDDPTEPWVLEDRVTNPPRKRHIFSKNIITDEVTMYETIVEAAAANGISTKLLEYYINIKHIRPKNCIVYRAEGDLPFPNYNKYQKLMAVANGDSLDSGLIVREEGREEKFYTKREEFLKERGITKGQYVTLVKHAPEKYIAVRLKVEYSTNL